MMTPKEAAEKARVSTALIYDWCAAEILPHVRLGAHGRRGKIMINESDLTAFLDAQKRGAIANRKAQFAADKP